MGRRSWWAAPRLEIAIGLALAAPGCALLEPPEPPPPPPREEPEPEIYLRAESVRSEWLEREVERLRADLRQAEQALVVAESGLRGTHTRADAVSAIAEARIELERVAERASWRQGEVDEARSKLDEADRQVEAGHFGSAIFFASRAQRIASTLDREVENAQRHPGTRFVTGRRVNLRAGPSTNDRVISVLVRSTPVFPERSEGRWVLVRSVSGEVGWIHASLLGDS